ncbi:MAG: VanZ family protein [Propionibacteriaceae bacterium]
MTSELIPAVIAISGGLLLAFVLFVPFVAVQYRRRGVLGFGPVVLGVGLLIYALALVSYTLLPLPHITDNFCSVHRATPQLHLLQFVRDIKRDDSGGLAGLPSDPAVLQFVFNIVLFVPFGMFARHLFRRGVAVSTLLGLAASLVIELTQLTGDWFLFPCAYRLFDVDDLLANSTGALIGALIAPVLRLVPGQQGGDPGEPRPITARRRLLGMLCDWAVGAGAGSFLSIVYRVIVAEGGLDVSPGVDATVLALLNRVVPSVLFLVLLAVAGRTVGEMVVRLRPRRPPDARGVLWRWAVGIGGYLLLQAPTTGGPHLLAAALAVVSVVMVVRSRGHRGLAYQVSRWELADDRSALDQASVRPGSG